MGLLSRMGRAATALSKYYYPFTWRNKPSIESPINEVHLNHIEDGINEMDNRILILAQDKADATDIANVFVDFAMDDTTGVMTFTRFDGSKVEHDSAVEKIALNCYLEDDNFVLELADGTKQKVSLSKFIDTYEFSSTDTIRMTVNGKNISAEIPDGKITLAKLEPTIMSTIRKYTLDAQTAQGVTEQAASTAQGWAIGGTGFEDNNAKHYASRSQRYAVGGVEEGDTEDNAKYYCQQAQAAAEHATGAVGFDGTASTVSAIDTQGIAIRKASGTGHVTITDAAEHPILNLNLAGKSEQGADPSPNNPQEIVSTDVTAVTVTGAQLLNLGEVEKQKTIGGITYTIDSQNGTITANGTATETSFLSMPISIPKGEKIYIGAGNTSVVPSGNIQVLLRLSGDNGVEASSNTYLSNQHATNIFTTTQHCNFVHFRFGDGEVVNNFVIKPMIAFSDKPLPWQSYQSRTAAITLTEPLHGIGDVRDKITMHKRIDRCVEMTFDGSENWRAYDGDYYGFYLGDCLPVGMNRRIGLCNQAVVDAAATNMANRIWLGTGGNKVLYAVKNSFYDDAASDKGLSAWKAHLAAHPLKVVTYLDTPVETDLDATTVAALNALTTYTGTTHVTITAGGPEPDVGLEYFGQPGDKVTVQDMCDSFAAPGFDDSGVVQGISGFGDFLGRITSKMRLPDFFRDLKAGLKFVLHTGQLVNNGLCNEPGKYPLDAAYGRTLLEMIGNTANLPGGAADIVSAIVTQNSNLTGKTNTSDFNAFKNMIGFVGLSGMSFGYDGTFVNIWWLFGANKEYGHALNIKISDGTLQFYNLINGTWNIAWTK